MHDIAGVGITIATILAATFFNNQNINSLRSELHSEVNGLRSEIMTKLETIQRDMRDLYTEQGPHDIRITNLEQQHKN